MALSIVGHATMGTLRSVNIPDSYTFECGRHIDHAGNIRVCIGSLRPLLVHLALQQLDVAGVVATKCVCRSSTSKHH